MKDPFYEITVTDSAEFHQYVCWDVVYQSDRESYNCKAVMLGV